MESYPVQTVGKIKVNNVAVKIASRCNLNCSYCYIYNMGDTAYKSQPKFIAWEIVDKTFARIRQHCVDHQLTEFAIYIFGGEPFLAGKEFFREFVTRANATLSDVVTLRFLTQTNGVLIDDEWLDLLNELNIRYGLSLDGPKEINDKLRVDHAGRGSFDNVMTAVQRMAARGISPGINSVINYKTDPLTVYNFFKEIGVGDLDFLVPDGNFAQLPPGLHHTEGTFDWNNTPYADWLIAIFNQWFHEARPKPEIKLFKTIINLIFGKNDGYDYVGTKRNELLIIETNGDIEAADDFKICGNGFTKRGYNVTTNSFDDALTDDLMQEYNLSGERLCDKCARCPIVDICGGWYVPTRYGSQNKFANPSVFCPDALKLIAHIQNAILTQFESEGIETAGVTKLDYLKASEYLESMTLNN